MADPVVTISAVTSIGRNFATMNGSITPNATSHSWWTLRGLQTLSDTEYFFEFTTVSGGDGPIVLASAETEAYGNATDYPPVGTHSYGSGSSPVSLTQIAYMLSPGAIYYVRLIAWRYLYPGNSEADRYARENQPYQVFASTTETFTTLP